MSNSHKWGVQLKKIFGLAPWGPGEGSKGQISLNFNYKVNFKDFYFKLCVCSHKCKIQNISDRFFILSPESSPKGGTWGYLGAKIKFRPAVCPLCYLLLKHWTKFNQILCVSYSYKWGAQRKFFLAPPPGVLGRGQKVKYYLISITKSISKTFISNFVCVLNNERYKTYQTGFFILSSGSSPRGGTWGYLGAKIKFCPAVYPLCYLLLNHWTIFNQIWCVSCSNEWGAQRFFLPRLLWPLGGSQMVKYHLISITKSISKIFIPNVVCVLTNERYKTYQTGFLFCRRGYP